MKIHDPQGKHVKTVPKRFEMLQNLFAYFTDLKHKRLARDERTSIEIALFIQGLSPGEKKIIGDKKPTEGRCITPRDGDVYYSILLGDKEFKCPKYIYNLMGKKNLIQRLF